MLAKQAASFEAACDAIAAVRKAKADAGVSLGRPLTSLEVSSNPEFLGILQTVAADVAAAAGANNANLSISHTQPVAEMRYAVRIVPAEAPPSS